MYQEAPVLAVVLGVESLPSENPQSGWRSQKWLWNDEFTVVGCTRTVGQKGSPDPFRKIQEDWQRTYARGFYDEEILQSDKADQVEHLPTQRVWY